MEFFRDAVPGKALDIGCGSGTHAVYMARCGWEVTGVDFSSEAIHKARQKAEAAGLRIDFHVADVTGSGVPSSGYDYALDIGCLFSLPENRRPLYAQMLKDRIKPGGLYMMFSWLPWWKKGRKRGISPEDAAGLFEGAFMVIRTQLGEEKGRPCAWHWLERKHPEVI
jgi:cyclopropane fatty-acyl-phospholipid synthase-like methyltransferase